jgi:hypothetical protein
MIILGLILLILRYVLGISLLYYLGGILHHPADAGQHRSGRHGRRHYF